MAFEFTPACQKASPPVVYLVESFLHGPEGGILRGNLRQYPSEVQDAFTKVLTDNLALPRRRTRTDGPSKPAPPLFVLKWVGMLNAVPSILGCGDIILGFAHKPPYIVNVEDARVEIPPALSISGQVARALNKQWFDFIHAKWLTVTADPPPEFEPKATPGPLAPKEFPTNAGDTEFFDIGPQTITLRKGGRQSVYGSVRVGVIDVGFAAVEAARVWHQSKTLHEKIGLLRSQPQQELGPVAVKNLFAAAGRNAGDYASAVGRGLAYTLLHEFWHNATHSGDHPYQEQVNTLIESALSPSPLRIGLQLKPESVRAIESEYRTRWCRYRHDKRLGLHEL